MDRPRRVQTRIARSHLLCRANAFRYPLRMECRVLYPGAPALDVPYNEEAGSSLPPMLACSLSRGVTLARSGHWNGVHVCSDTLPNLSNPLVDDDSNVPRDHSKTTAYSRLCAARGKGLASRAPPRLMGGGVNPPPHWKRQDIAEATTKLDDYDASGEHEPYVLLQQALCCRGGCSQLRSRLAQILPVRELLVGCPLSLT